jgi:hypothetical protein
MRTKLAILVLGGILANRAEQLLLEHEWQASEANRIAASQVTNNVLRIASTNAPLRVELLRIEKPPISGNFYAIQGRIRYEGVAGDGLLEMWNVFAPEKKGAAEGRYFSRTLGESGEMGKISGSSDWRTFQLPFNRTGTTHPPKRLEINLVLPGAGIVDIEPIKLVEYSGGFGGPTGAWWSNQTAGWIGGIGGSMLGCLGGLLGFLVAKRKARGFVLTSASVLIALGCVLSIAGIAAVMTRQPYAVWFPLVLGAALLLTIIPLRLRGFQRVYEDQELRRMTAFDSGTP